jgi:hypothetical protein
VGDSSARVWEDSTVLFSAPAAAAELATLGSDVLGADFDGGVFHWNTSTTVRETFPAPVRELWTAPWDRVYGVGPDGQIVVHDGSSWSFLRETRPAKQLNTIFGAPDGALFAMGVASYALDGNEWSERSLSTPYTVSAGWAVSRSFAIAVGQSGAIDHWDGAAWNSVPSPITGNLTDVWASSETDAFAVAFDTTVLHFDGTAWSVMTRLPFNLKAVHGTAPDDVYACGVRSVFHYDGSVWDETSIPTDTVLDVIWAESTTSVFVGGGDGVIFHYDGATWERTPTPTDAAILDLWVRGPGGVYALAEDGLILRFDGAQWRVRAMAPGRAALSLWGTDREIFVAGYGTTVFRVEE